LETLQRVDCRARVALCCRRASRAGTIQTIVSGHRLGGHTAANTDGGLYHRILAICQDPKRRGTLPHIRLQRIVALVFLLCFHIRSNVKHRGNASLITKVRLPTEVFPLATILARGMDLVIASMIFLAMMIFYQVPPTVHLLWLIPLLFIQLLLMVGICLFLAAIDVFYRDIDFAIGLVMQLWMYLSPIAYPVSIIPERYRGVYMLNPMTPIMDGYRKATLHATTPDWNRLIWVVLVAVVILILAYWFFKAREREFADIV